MPLQSDRKIALRADLRAALAAALPDVTWVQDWFKPALVSQLPRGAVFTPRVVFTNETTNSRDGAVDVVVALKVSGGADIDDVLDVKGALADAAALGCFAAVSDDFELTEMRSDASSDGSTVTGEINLFYRVVLRDL